MAPTTFNRSPGTLVTGWVAGILAISFAAGTISAASGPTNVIESNAPRKIFIGEPIKPDDEGRLVEIEGTVTFMGRRGDACELELSSEAGHMRVTVTDTDKNLRALLPRSRVRIQGICRAVHGGVEGDVTSSLSANGRNDVIIVQAPEETWQEYPEQPLAAVTSTPPGAIVHLRARITSEPATGQFILTQGSDRLRAAGSSLFDGDAEVLGELDAASSNALFRVDVIRAVGLQRNGKSSLPLLTSTEQIRWLKLREARRKYPVKIRALITFLMGPLTNSAGNLQDAAGGIYAWHLLKAARKAAIHAGDFCEIEGETSAGNFSPGINCRRITVLGPGQFPEPVRPTWTELATGSLDAQWVEIKGMVVSTVPQHIEIARPGGVISCFVSGCTNVDQYLNAVVRVRGVVASDWDLSRHVQDQHLNLPGEEFISVENPPPTDPFALRAKRVKDLLSYDPAESAFRREKVSGVIVTARDGIYYLMSDGVGLRLAPPRRSRIVAGDLVDAVGFPNIDNSVDPPLVTLEQAQIRVTGTARLPVARQITQTNLVSSGHDATLVKMEARLVNQSLYGADQVLQLQTGVQSYFARLRAANGVVPSLPAGSRLEVTGVYVFNNGKIGSRPQSGPFELLLNSPSDVAVLELPSWWTSQHAVMVVSGMTVVILLGLIWIHALRGQVARRTMQLSGANRSLEAEIVERKRAENELVQTRLQHLLERERTRIARDIHDELGCSLSQIRLLSEMSLAHSHAPEEVQTNARKVSSKALDATRVLDEIVWAVDPQNDTLESLLNYLFSFASDYLSLAGIRFRIDGPTQIPHHMLTTQVRHQLYMTVKETLTNIVNHAQATEVWMRLRIESGEVCFVIEDNGRGFDLDNGAGSSPGASGLDNMRRRFHEIGGTFALETAPAHGTRVNFVLPLNQAAKA